MFRRVRENIRNNEGQTKCEFLQENADIPQLALIMWHLNIKREDLANELKTLLKDDHNVLCDHRKVYFK